MSEMKNRFQNNGNGNIPSYPNLPADDLPPPYFPAGMDKPAPAQPQPQVVRIVQNPMLGSRSARVICPHCRADVSTRVTSSPGVMTHLWGVILCLVCFPLCCVPYCVDECMDAEHECPNCGRFVGTYRR